MRDDKDSLSNGFEGIADQAILNELEKKYKGLRYGGWDSSSTPAVPHAREIGEALSSKTVSPEDSSSVIITKQNSANLKIDNSAEAFLNITIGDICLFPNGEVGVCRQSAQGAPYGIFLICLADGRTEERGVLLDVNQPIQIGHLSNSILSAMLTSKTWNRDLLVFSLRSVEYIPYLPHISGTSPNVLPDVKPMAKPDAKVPKAVSATAAAPAKKKRKIAASDEKLFAPPRAPKAIDPEGEMPFVIVPTGPQSAAVPASAQAVVEAPPFDPSNPLVKGREITIKHTSKKKWNAVYMGVDEIGHILAFKTMNGWELTRVNLEDYWEKIDFGPCLTSRQIQDIEDDVLRNG